MTKGPSRFDAESTNPTKKFAERLRRKMFDTNIRTNTELAELTGYSVTEIRDALLGTDVPSEGLVRKILKVCAERTNRPLSENDLESWLAEHRQLRPNRYTAGRVQQNIFQDGRGYTYVDGTNVIIGAGNFSTNELPDNQAQIRLYLSDLEEEIGRVAKWAKRRLMTYRVLRFIVLTTSAITPALALLEAAPILTASAGSAAFLAEGAIQLTRINERAVGDGRRVSRLSREFRMFRTQVGDYAADNPFPLLVRRVEEIREESDHERLKVIRQSFGTEDATPIRASK